MAAKRQAAARGERDDSKQECDGSEGEPGPEICGIGDGRNPGRRYQWFVCLDRETRDCTE